jgi:phage tail sheath gpL-like
MTASVGLTALNRANPQLLPDAFRAMYQAGYGTDTAVIGIGDLLNQLIALANQGSGSTAASRAATYGGTATAGDVLTLTIDGVDFAHTVVDDTSVTTAMAEMVAALNADDTFSARYTASNAAGVITATAKRKGTGMNGTTFVASKVGTGTFVAAGATMTGGLLLDDILPIADA